MKRNKTKQKIIYLEKGVETLLMYHGINFMHVLPLMWLKQAFSSRNNHMEKNQSKNSYIWEIPPRDQEVFLLYGLYNTWDERKTLIKRITGVKEGMSEANSTNYEGTDKNLQNLKVNKKECASHTIAVTSTDRGLQISGNAKMPSN